MDWEERLDQWELELELTAQLEGSDWVTLERASMAAAEAANRVITNPPPGVRNMSEWAKKQACWAELAKQTTMEDFYTQAPALNPARSLITGTICGIRVEEIEEPVMRELRYLDKLIDELAKGRPMERILRK